MYWLIIGKKRVCARSPGVLQYESDTGSLYLQSETEREREREREREIYQAPAWIYEADRSYTYICCASFAHSSSVLRPAKSSIFSRRIFIIYHQNLDFYIKLTRRRIDLSERTAVPCH